MLAWDVHSGWRNKFKTSHRIAFIVRWLVRSFIGILITVFCLFVSRCELNGMGWDGMGWDGMGWRRQTDPHHRVVLSFVVSLFLFFYIWLSLGQQLYLVPYRTRRRRLDGMGWDGWDGMVENGRMDGWIRWNGMEWK